jgi:hypothetical protein
MAPEMSAARSKEKLNGNKLWQNLWRLIFSFKWFSLCGESSNNCKLTIIQFSNSWDMLQFSSVILTQYWIVLNCVRSVKFRRWQQNILVTLHTTKLPFYVRSYTAEFLGSACIFTFCSACTSVYTVRLLCLSLFLCSLFSKFSFVSTVFLSFLFFLC